MIRYPELFHLSPVKRFSLYTLIMFRQGYLCCIFLSTCNHAAKERYPIAFVSLHYKPIAKWERAAYLVPEIVPLHHSEARDFHLADRKDQRRLSPSINE